MNHRNSCRQSSSRFPPWDQLVMGVHAVHELLLHSPKRLIRIYTASCPKLGPRKSKLLELCKKEEIPVLSTTIDALTEMTGSDSHQSVVAHVKGRVFLEIKDFLKKVETKESSLVLMVDHIFDPQNFGALIRSAECLGADAIVWSKNRGADITPVVAKASSGASELLALIRISNLAEAMSSFQRQGFEAVVTLLEERAESAWNFLFAPRTLLIVGSEGDGIQPLICKKADRSLFIPMQGKVGSLNVSQAATLLMGFYQKQIMSQII